MSYKITVLPPGFMKNFKPKRIKILSLDITRAGFLSIAVLAMTLSVFIPKASATPSATAPSRCSDTGWLLDDDWVTVNAKHTVTIQPGNLKGVLDVSWSHHASTPSQFSMIIGRTVGSTDTHQLQIFVVDNSDTGHWELTKDSTGYYATTTTPTAYPNTYSFNSLNDWNWNATTHTEVGGKAWPYVLGNPQYQTPVQPPQIAFSCIVTVQNVTYSAGWDGAAFSTKLLYGTSTIQCDKLDIGCWIGKAWTGVADTFTSVGQALLQGIANLFAPDTNDIKSSFDDLNTTFTTRLGFLTYPFEFIGGVFTAFTSSSSWCTSSSCTKSFGNFYGHNFTIDFNAMASVMPTMWAWLLGLIRGTTILTLILAIRRKYLGVVGK